MSKISKKHLRKTFSFFQVNISPCCMQLNITIVCKNDHFVGDILLLNAHHGPQNHLPTAQPNLDESRLGTCLSKKTMVLPPESLVVISPIFKNNHTSFDLQMFCGVSYRHSFLKLPAGKNGKKSTQLAKKRIFFCPCQNLATALCLSQKLLDELVSEPMAGKKRKAWKNGTCFFFKHERMYNRSEGYTHHTYIYNIVVYMHMYICMYDVYLKKYVICINIL